MRTLQGIAVSPGIAIGEALVIDNEGFLIPRQYVPREAVEDELRRFDLALEAAAKEVEQNRDSVTAQLGEQVGTIFDAHLQMLRDPGLRRDIEAGIRERAYSAEFAVNATLGALAKRLREASNPVLAERAHDIVDLERCLLRHLTGRTARRVGEPHVPGGLGGPQPDAQRDREAEAGIRPRDLSPKSAAPGGTRRLSPKGWRSRPWSAWAGF